MGLQRISPVALQGNGDVLPLGNLLGGDRIDFDVHPQGDFGPDGPLPVAAHRPVLGLGGGVEGGPEVGVLDLLYLGRVLPRIVVQEPVVEHLDPPDHLPLVSRQGQGELLVAVARCGVRGPVGVPGTLPVAVVFHPDDEGCRLPGVLGAAADQEVGRMGLLQLVADREAAVVLVVEGPLGRAGGAVVPVLVAGQVGLSRLPVLAVGADPAPLEGEFLGGVIVGNRQGGEGARLFPDWPR